jgi:hypothetical protein
MDTAKCQALKGEIATQPEPQLVGIERFFGGNDDPDLGLAPSIDQKHGAPVLGVWWD